MFHLFEKITDLSTEADVIRRRRYGVIEIVDGQLQSVTLRPWPKLISVAEIGWLGAATHQNRVGDRCLLYYNQPLSSPNFLALKYVVSNLGTSYRSFRQSLIVLDRIAQIKKTDALVCEASNKRISDRFLKRMGWERHLESSRRRHYIKRFYGVYPDQPDVNARPSRKESAA